MSVPMSGAMKRAITSAMAVSMLPALPAAARACAACAAGVDRNRSIFLFTTILLSLLPLVLVGAGLLWIARRSRERLAGEFAEREEPAQRPTGAGAGARGAGSPVVAAPSAGRGA